MKWSIGDIHGCYHTLMSLIARVEKEDSHPEFIFLGDYFDRGKWSSQVIDRLLAFNEGQATFLLGNHDDVISWLLTEKSRSYPSEWVTIPPTEEKIVKWWLNHGLDSTLTAYGVEWTKLWPSVQKIIESFRNNFPESHLKFLTSNLKLYWEGDKHFAMHAYLSPGTELPWDMKFLKLEPNSVLWSRFGREQVYGQSKWDKIGIFGHFPTKFLGSQEAIASGQIRMVDTGACMGGKLTAYCLDSDSFISVDADARDLLEKWTK